MRRIFCKFYEIIPRTIKVHFFSPVELFTLECNWNKILAKNRINDKRTTPRMIVHRGTVCEDFVENSIFFTKFGARTPDKIIFDLFGQFLCFSTSLDIVCRKRSRSVHEMSICLLKWYNFVDCTKFSNWYRQLRDRYDKI